MERNDNFTSLWAALKEQVREARTARRYDRTEIAHEILPSRWISVSHGDRDGSALHTTNGREFISRDELVKLAAHCICAAEEIDADMLPHEIDEREAKQAVSALVSDAHAGMMGLTTRERFPADDEQRDAE